jgi:hypothetical protein
MQKCGWIGARVSGSLTSDLGRVLGIGGVAQACMMFASCDSWVMSHHFITVFPSIELWVVMKSQRSWLPPLNTANTTAHTR